MRNATRISADGLHCARVGVWMFTDSARDAIVGALVWDGRTQHFENDGQVLNERDYPAYFAALRDRRAIVAHDARTNEATHELAASYLVPRGITSMLDAAIYRGGEIVGVVCHEHVGPQRQWDDHECAFATSVADMLALTLERAERVAAERALRKLEAEQAEAHRLETIARIAGVLGHDMNNLLSVILSSADALARVQVTAEALDLVGAIRDAGTRGASLSRKLLDVGRVALHPHSAKLALSRFLEGERPILESALGARGTLTMDAVEPAVTVTIGGDELDRVLLNLVTNARDAIAVGGHVHVGVRVDERDVEVSVADDGVGMPPDVAARAFDPFFTTKAKDVGTGLGLAIVRAIVERCGGRTEIESEPARGTTVRLLLPRA